MPVFPRLSLEISYNVGLGGGGRGIRTPGTVSRTAVFKTACFNRSHIPPHERMARLKKVYRICPVDLSIPSALAGLGEAERNDVPARLGDFSRQCGKDDGEDRAMPPR